MRNPHNTLAESQNVSPIAPIVFMSDPLQIQTGLVFKHLPHPLCFFSLEKGRILAVNASAVALLGYSEREFCQMLLRDFIEAGDLQRLRARQAAGQAEQGGVGGSEICQLKHKTGEGIHMQVSLRILWENQPPVGMLLAHDASPLLKSEKLRHEEQSKLRILAHTCPLPLISLDRQGNVTAWNRAAEQVFGASREEIIGRKLPRLSAAREEAFVRLCERVWQGETVWRVEVPRARLNGSVFPAALSASPLKDADGHIIGLVAYIEDMENLLHLQDQVNEGVSLSRIAGKMARLGAWTIDVPAPQIPKKGLVPVPKQLDAILRQYPYLASMISTYLPGDQEALAIAFAACVEQGQSFDLQARVVNSRGDVRMLRSTGEAVQDDQGRILRIQGGVQDVTEFAESARMLNLRSAALEAVENMLVITDARGCVEWANASFYRITGYAPAETLGKNLGELVGTQHHPPAFFDKMWKTIQSGHVWHGEIINRTKMGEPLIEEVTITPFRESGRDISHYVAVKQDITEKKKIEKQVLRAQRTDSLGALAGGIAHDLNNVLAPILMGLELIRMDMSDTDPNLKLVDSLMESAGRGSALVRQILTFSRGGEGEKMEVDLRFPLRELQKMVERTFPRNIESHFSAASDLWRIHAEPTQMYQVMLNLCMNARDAMPSGGRLTATLQNCILDATYSPLHPGLSSGPHVLLEIRDTGTGIPTEVWDKLFDPFFTTKAPGEGTGLGLATLQQIVTKHGGRVQFDSQMGEGTVFRVYLPADTGERNQSNEDALQRKLPRGSGEWILVAEDEDPIRALAQDVFERFGYKVHAVGNGRAAVNAVLESPDHFQIVVMDIDMPILNGLDAVKEIRKLHPGLPVLCCSGHTPPGIQQDPAAFGIQEFLPKPYSAEQLLTNVYMLLHPVENP